MKRKKELPEIVQYDTPLGKKVLRVISDEVNLNKISNQENQTLIQDLKSTLSLHSDGVGLSAPQIAINKRVFVINPNVYHNSDEFLISPELISKTSNKTVFINPKIIKISKDKKNMEEGCLSVRPWYGKVKRASRVTIKAYDENGQEFEVEGRGLLAQAFQHEIDHLDGILFIDKAKDLKKIEKQVE